LTQLLQSIDPSISKVEVREVPKKQLPTDLLMVREPKPHEKAATIVIKRVRDKKAGKAKKREVEPISRKLSLTQNN